MDSGNKDLVGVLGDFARLAVDSPVSGLLHHLVIRSVEVLAVASAAAVLAAEGSWPACGAASGAALESVDRLDGLALAAYRTNAAVSAPDLRDAPRPARGGRVDQPRSGGAFAFPLRYGDTVLGALEVYRPTPGPLPVATMAAAQILADVTAAYVCITRQRSALRADAAVARRNSLHDPLTGVPNRVLLLDGLSRALLRSERPGKTVTILFVDLDRFKAINDRYGHRIGDELLVAVASRLTRLLRPGDLLGRLAGDEFVVLCEDLVEPEEATALERRVTIALAKPFAISNLRLAITASVGMAHAAGGNRTAGGLLHEADQAMYAAKRRSRPPAAITEEEDMHADPWPRTDRPRLVTSSPQGRTGTDDHASGQPTPVP